VKRRCELLEAVVAIDARDLAENMSDLELGDYHVEVVRRAYRCLLSAKLTGFDGTLPEPFVHLELPDGIIVVNSGIPAQL